MSRRLFNAAVEAIPSFRRAATRSVLQPRSQQNALQHAVSQVGRRQRSGDGAREMERLTDLPDWSARRTDNRLHRLV